MINIGIIGCGYWGPNLVRNFDDLDDCRVLEVCDILKQRLRFISRKCPSALLTTDYTEIMNNPKIDAVAIATPTATHYQLAREAIIAGKHVFIEKPMTATSIQAEKLIGLAKKKKKILMVDHTFVYTPAVREMKKIILSGELGKIYYYDSVRVNLGLFQHDANVIWDLAPHEFSIIDYLIDKKPIALSATGVGHIRGQHENIAYVTIFFPRNLLAHFHINWLAPMKVRTTLIGGSKKMIVYDDLQATEKVKVYAKGINVKSREGIYNKLVQYRSGDMYAPHIENTEALKIECQHFINCLKNNKKPITDGTAGLKVVRLLEACQESLQNSGRKINLGNIRRI
jgi:predicted dehydrogenase